MKTCSVEGCSRPFIAKGLCHTHYTQKWRKGNVTYLERHAADERAWRIRNPTHRTWPRKRFSRSKMLAAQRGRVWTITLPEYTALLEKGCHYCTADLLHRPGTGLDRVDNMRGYELDNVLPCCPPCNRMRNNLVTVTEFEVMMTALLAFRRSQERTGS
jgi:hypothetical protein